MSEKKSLFERFKDAGQAVVIAATLSGMIGAVSVKAWGWVNAGPVALSKAQKLEKDVRRLKLQSRFTVRVLEKIGKEKYDWKTEERDIAAEESRE